MEPPKNYILGYHPSNQEEALIVQSYLSKAGYKLTHLKSSAFENSGDFASAIIKGNQPVILLVSDNFLKSEDCLYLLFDNYKEIKDERDFEIIVCDGKIKTEEDFTTVKTSFEKLSGVIKYLNFWQNKYLETRAKKRSIPETESENFGNYLRIIRSISTQVGDFLKSLTENGVLEFSEMANTNFENFYLRVNDTEGFEKYLQNLASEAAEELVLTEVEETEVNEEPSVEIFPLGTLLAEKEGNSKVKDTPLSGIVSIGDFKSADEIIDEIEIEENMNIADLVGNDEVKNLDSLFQKEHFENRTNGEINEIIQKAHSFFKLENQADGLKVLKDGLEANPKNSSLKYEYGASLARYAGSLNLAKFHLKENLELDPQHTKTLFLLGKMAELEGEHQTAINFYNGVVESQPNFPDVNFRLGLLMMINNSSDINKIKGHFKKEIKLNPKNTEANYRLGTLLAENTDKTAKALKQFQEVLKLSPNHKFVNYDIALLYYKNGQMDKAKLYYDKACTINPELKTQDNDIAFGIRKVIKRVKTSRKSIPIVKSNGELPIASTPSKIEVQKDTKTILITGATSGIGKAIALAFAATGNARLILTGRRIDRLSEMKIALEKDKIDSLTLNFDVRNSEEVVKAVESIPESWRNIDILVNNAGLAKGFEPIHEGQLEHWETMIDTNVKGLLYMTRLISPFMVKKKSGHIINICSIAGKEVYPNGGVYCATKHAVDALTKGMRIDLHKYNIRVSQIAPGHVEDTEFAEVRFDGDKERAKIYEDFKPVTSKDVAEVVYFIATRPAHVNIQDVLMMGTQQASATIVNRSGR